MGGLRTKNDCFLGQGRDGRIVADVIKGSDT